MEQEKNIYIKGILENAPKGLKLYSPVYGEVEYLGLTDFETSKKMFSESKPMIEIYAKNVGKFVFDDYGKWYKSGECLLFPSKDKSWNYWQSYLFRDGDIIYGETTNSDASGVLLIYHVDKGMADVINCKGVRTSLVPTRLFRYATPSEKKSFIKELEKIRFAYDTDKKVLERIEESDSDTARRTFTFEDIGQDTLITPYAGYEPRIENGKVILSKVKEPFFKAGEKYIALKDINVSKKSPNGKFVKGKIYVCEEDNTVKNEYCGLFIDRHDGKGSECFLHVIVK